MSLEVTVKGFKKCCISNATDGMLGVSVKKMKVLTLKKETMTLIYNGRWNLMWFSCIYTVHLTRSLNRQTNTCTSDFSKELKTP